MKIILLTFCNILLSTAALPDDNAYSNQYIQAKQDHAAALREQANERILYLRNNKGHQANVISTGASLEALQPAAGGPDRPPVASKPAVINDNNPQRPTTVDTVKKTSQ